MKKRGYLLVSYILITVLLIKFSFAASLIPSSNSGNLIADTLRPLGIANPGEIYKDYGYFIDFILFLVIFITLARTAFGNRIDRRASTGLGVLLAFGLASFEKQRQFKLGDLGALWGVVMLLLLGALAFRLFRGREGEHKFTGFAVAYLLTWLIASFILTDEDREALGLFWGWFQFIAIIILIISIIKLFTWIFRSGGFPTRNELGNIATDIGNVGGAIGRGIGRGAESIRKARAGMVDASKERKIQVQMGKLDILTKNIEQKIQELGATELKNENDRLAMLTQIEVLVRGIYDIHTKFKSKDPNVIAQAQGLRQKYEETIKNLSTLIQNFYNKLLEERQRIVNEKKLQEQEIRYLDLEIKQELNSQSKTFKQLRDEINYVLKSDKNPDLENKFNQITQMRSNMTKILLEIRSIVKGDRSKNFNVLEDLNKQDIQLTNNFYQALAARDFGKALGSVRQLRTNLGTEISLSNSDILKNNKILELRNQLQTYHAALISLDKEVTEYLYRITNTQAPT